MSFCLNHGIMELWNDGIVGFQRILSILQFIVKTNLAIYPILQYPKTHFPLAQTEFTKCEFYAFAFVRLNKK